MGNKNANTAVVTTPSRAATTRPTKVVDPTVTVLVDYGNGAEPVAYQGDVVTVMRGESKGDLLSQMQASFDFIQGSFGDDLSGGDLFILRKRS